MNTDEPATSPKAPPPPCTGCGRDSDAVIDGKGWCVDCYQGMGSCCSAEWLPVLIAETREIGQDSR